MPYKNPLPLGVSTHRLTVVLRSDEVMALKLAASAYGTSMNNLIRSAVAIVLADTPDAPTPLQEPTLPSPAPGEAFIARSGQGEHYFRANTVDTVVPISKEEYDSATNKFEDRIGAPSVHDNV